MAKFEVGRDYRVQRLSVHPEFVTITRRVGDIVTLADGRKVGILKQGDGGEFMRLDVRGSLAVGGVVRASCEREAAP